MTEEGAYGRRISEHFRLEAKPALVVKDLRKVSFAATRLSTDRRGHGITLPIPPEDAVLAIVQLRDLPTHELWMEGKPINIGPQLAGRFSVVNLGLDPIAYLPEPFDCVHFYLPRAVFDRMTDDTGVRRIDGLDVPPGVSVDDPAVRHLALALLPALDRPQEAHQLFVDHIAAAMHLHLARTYGGMRPPSRVRGGLAPWQLRRAIELLAANLNGEIELAAIASECDLSVSHFTRAFRRSTGTPPHRWLLARRVDLAKRMLRSTQRPLAEIATACGFADQSHFTRVFRFHTGATPGEWRRELQ